MTTVSTQSSERLTRNNALPLLVDHQVGSYTGVRDIDVRRRRGGVRASGLSPTYRVVRVSRTDVPLTDMADNAAPEAEVVYAALGVPFSTLVFGLRQYYSQASVITGKRQGHEDI